jgi:Uma2 family endonuclease
MRISSTEVQNSFGKYLKMVLEQEPVIITRNGRDVARIDRFSGSGTLILAEPSDSSAYIASAKKVSYQDYLELTANSEDRYELIDGELYLQDSPVYHHQAVLGELFSCFHSWFKGKSCRPLYAPFDVTLLKGPDNINVVQPDILVICDMDKIDSQGKYHGVPTLVVEAVSPSTKRKDMLKKLDLYLQTGVSEYWLIDPDKRAAYLYSFATGDITDNQVTVGDGVIRSNCFPGLEVRLSDLFTW